MIYGIAEVNDRTAVKIGHTMTYGHASVSLAGLRLSQLQVGNRRELEVIAYATGDVRHEGELHQRFAVQHIRGEWFKLTGCVLEWVEAHAAGRLTPRQARESRAEALKQRENRHEQERIADMMAAAIRIVSSRQ